MSKSHTNRMTAIIKKEYLHIIHDFRTLAILFLMPTLQLIMFGYALNLEIQKVDLNIVDFANSTYSRKLIDEFRGSKFFNLSVGEKNLNDADSMFKNREAKAIMVIPKDFDRQILLKPVIPVQFLFDASNANSATLIKNYCIQVLTNFNISNNFKIELPFELRSKVFFNPDFKSSHFFVPGLVAMILMMISALLTSVTIAKEKETGTLEQILVSPVRPREIIIGKILPYIFLAFIDASLILGVAILLFHVPFQGSAVLLVLLSILYIITALSMGLLISTVTSTQQVAMMISQMATLLPTIMLSGLIFPIAAMPKFLQYFSYIVPARFYLLIVRGILLKGSTLTHLLTPVIILSIYSLVLLNIAARKFSLNLEK